MIKPLTSFRFFAAIFVFLSHLDLMMNSKATKWIYSNIFYEGYIGVTFFFILSGFILTYNYHDKFTKINKINYLNFLKARMSRIYPVYLLTFFISVPLSLKLFLSNPLDVSLKGILNLFMVQSFIPVKDVYFSFNAPSWSISDEMFFYALLPFLIFIFASAKKINKPSTLIYLSLAFWIIPAALVFSMKDVNISHWLFYIFPVYRLFDFLIGISLGLLFIKLRNKPFSQNFYTLMEFAVIILLVTVFYFHPHIHQSLRFWGYYQPVMALIILVFAYQKGLISKLVSNQFLVFLGEASFSFYMLHQLVIRYLEHISIMYNNPILLLSASLIISFIGSIIVYKYFEIPVRNKLRNTYISERFYNKVS